MTNAEKAQAMLEMIITLYDSGLGTDEIMEILEYMVKDWYSLKTAIHLHYLDEENERKKYR